MQVYLYELNVGVPLTIECTDMIHTIKFEAVIKGKKGKALLIEAIRKEGVLINFDAKKIKKSIKVEVKGKEIIFSRVLIKKILLGEGEVIHELHCDSESIEENRRASKRFKIDEPCMFNINSEYNVKYATLHDICFTGFSFLSNEIIDLDKSVKVTLNDTSDRVSNALYLEGKIVRVDESSIPGLYSYGVQLKKESKQLQSFLIKLQRRRMATPSMLRKE